LDLSRIRRPGRLSTGQGADRILNGLNHGPFGEKNFFIPNGHWLCGPNRAMRRVLLVANHAVNHAWEAGTVLAAWLDEVRPGLPSRTATAEPAVPTSTQAPPLLPLWLSIARPAGRQRIDTAAHRHLWSW
jgi:hypothetical protein